MVSNMIIIDQQQVLHVAIFATLIFILCSPVISAPFPAANALTVTEGIQFTSNNATSTEVQEPFDSTQEAINNHLDAARQALRIGNLTMAVQELIFAIELQPGMSFDDSGIVQNETQSRMELQTAPFPPA